MKIEIAKTGIRYLVVDGVRYKDDDGRLIGTAGYYYAGLVRFCFCPDPLPGPMEVDYATFMDTERGEFEAACDQLVED